MTIDQMIDESGGERARLSAGLITELVQQDAMAAYERREEELTPEVMRELERRVVLSVLDRKWREHLYEMDYLREGITLRGYGQRDPLIEYQREGYDMFSSMMEGIKEESVGSLFNLQVQRQDSPIVEEAVPGLAANGSLAGGPVPGSPVPGGVLPAGPTPGGAPAGGNGSAQAGPAPAGSAAGGGNRSGRGRSGQSGSQARPGRHSRTGTQARSGQDQPGAQGGPAAAGGQAVPAGLAARGLGRPQPRGRLEYTAPSEDASGQAQQRTASSGGPDYSKVGRNAPCPCGSGRKYKLCHGDPRNR
jgi:preprotein translocase subunit SecA